MLSSGISGVSEALVLLYRRISDIIIVKMRYEKNQMKGDGSNSEQPETIAAEGVRKHVGCMDREQQR